MIKIIENLIDLARNAEKRLKFKRQEIIRKTEIFIIFPNFLPTQNKASEKFPFFADAFLFLTQVRNPL